MSDLVRITVDGVELHAEAGASLAAGLLNAGIRAFRRDLGGQPRAPLCGMGTCFECRVTLDGVSGVRACLEPVRSGMIVSTGET